MAAMLEAMYAFRCHGLWGSDHSAEYTTRATAAALRTRTYTQ